MPKSLLLCLTLGVWSVGCVEDGDSGGDPPEADAALADGEAPPEECLGGQERDACGECGGDGPSTWYPDVDGDGLGDGRAPVEGCDAPAGFVANTDDLEPDCATNDTDECGACGGPGQQTWYPDADGDGRGDDMLAVEACVAPADHVAAGGDPDPACATDDTDECGVCAGDGPGRFYADQDDDGLGDPAEMAEGCGAPVGFVDNADDADPFCATNDTDECGECGGPGPFMAYADEDGDGLGDPERALQVCFLIDGLVENADDDAPNCASNEVDDCDICDGGNRSMDCSGICDGAASLDGCGICSGGGTGIEPNVEDDDGDGLPNACDDCPIALNSFLVVQWQAVPHFDRRGGGPYTFQAILYQNGEFRFQYQNMEPFAASATVGYQWGPEEGNLISRNNDFVLDHPVVHVTPRDDGRLEANYFEEVDWFDISEVGEPLNFPDDGEREVELGFPFRFGGANYARVNISSNGIIVLDGNMPNFQNEPIPYNGTNRMLAPFWDDLNPANGGQVYWYVAQPACEEDCHGDLGGFAFEDACGLCVGGNSELRPSENVDCNGDCDGEAVFDACGQCSGGNTGREPLGEEDCRADLIIDQAYTARTSGIEYIDVDDECLVEERCVGGVGRRKILRFGTRIANIGPADLQLGRPMDGVDHWIWSQCHNHFHYEAYAAYDLYDVANDVVLPIGAKNGFSVIDIGVWDPELAPNGCRGYNGRNQGITSGCQDTYARNLQCQWIDITDVVDGEYELIVTTNPNEIIPEMSYDNNAARVRVEIEGDELRVLENEDP